MDNFFCPECKNSISPTTLTCPHCGFPLSRYKSTEEVVVIRRGFALAAAILTTIYSLFPILFYLGNFAPYMGNGGSSNPFGNSLYIHIFLLIAGIVLNWFGFSIKKRSLVLSSAILYSVSAACFILFSFFLVLPIVFGFIGYARMRPRVMRRIEFELDT